MFFSNSAFTKRIVTFVISLVCALFTFAVIYGFLYGKEKPELGAVIIVLLFDIAWVLSYIFFVSKK